MGQQLPKLLHNLFVITLNCYCMTVIVCVELCSEISCHFFVVNISYVLSVTFIVLQLAVVTEERNKLRNVANLKNEAGDESKSANPIKVVFSCLLFIYLIM